MIERCPERFGLTLDVFFKSSDGIGAFLGVPCCED